MVKKLNSTVKGAANKAAEKVQAKAAGMGGAMGGAAEAVMGALQGNALAGAVKDSAQQIWLAGMGAFSKAQEEGGKVFEALVKEGMSLQKKTQGLAEEKISEVTGKMTAMADTVTNKAGQNWDKLEAIFEQRTAKAMNKLGVPTAKDVAALTQRVDELAAAVAKLSKTESKAAKAAKTVKAVVVKAPVKRAIRRVA
jgi:poly(hydroxyalkanoate) granule-associated protein